MRRWCDREERGAVVDVDVDVATEVYQIVEKGYDCGYLGNDFLRLICLLYLVPSTGIVLPLNNALLLTRASLSSNRLSGESP
jgi:hypothetical protein